MEKKAVSGITLTLILIGMLTLTFNIQLAKAEPTTIIVPDDYPTIQEAINAASQGDTVFVSRGTYYEHLSINKPIQLLGENKHNTAIDGNSSETLIYVNSNNVTITGFTLRNAGKSWPEPHHYKKPDCTVWVYNHDFTNISDNIVTGAAVGIFLGYARNATVWKNNISESEIAGIIFYSATNSRAQGNIVTSSKIMGIHLDYYTNNCIVANNSIVDNPEGIGMDIEMGSNGNLFEGNLLANNHAGIFLFELGSNNVFKGNNMTGNRYNFGAWGFSLNSFIQDIDTSNIVNNKPIFYMVNRHHILITSTNLTIPGYLALVNSSGIIVEDLNFSDNLNGILLAQSTNCTIKNLNLSKNHEGMLLFNSSKNIIFHNWLDDNSVAAIVYSSNQNVFYQNSFLNNTRQILSQYLSGANQPFGPSGFSTNEWDNGLEGNFWSDYNGTDSNGDGIGDSPYIIDANNQDNYPLMDTWIPPVINATIDIDPDTLNLISKGKWISAYIELPENYDVADIDVSTIMVNGNIPVDLDAPTEINDYDEDGTLDLMVKFNRTAVTSYIQSVIGPQGRFGTVTLLITGNLDDGTPFQGSATIKIIYIDIERLEEKMLRYENYMQKV